MGRTRQSDYSYTNVGDLQKLTFPDQNNFIGYNYDPDHNLKNFTNPRQQQSTFTLAPDDSRLTTCTRGDGSQVNFTNYDWAGRVQTISDGQTTFTYEYDDNTGLLLNQSCVYAGLNPAVFTQNTSYLYNRDGSLASIQDSIVGIYNYTYDRAGRVTDLKLPSGDPVHYKYDPGNRLIEQDTPYDTTTYAYNAVGQLTDQKTVNAFYQNPALNKTLAEFNSFQYDAAGNLLGYTWICPQFDSGPKSPFSNTFQFAYDNFDHLIAENSAGNLPFQAPYTTAYNWSHNSDAADNLTQLRGNTYTTNVDDQVTFDSFTHNNGAYAYDADGNPTLYQNLVGAYDTEGHLTSFSNPNAAPTVPQRNFTFGYRPDGLRAWMTGPHGTVYYFYLGGRLAAETNGTDYTVVYGWGAIGLTEAASSWTDFITTYTYDPLGNVSGRRYSRVAPDGSVVPWTQNAFDVVSLYDAFGWTRGSWTGGAGQAWVRDLVRGDTVGWGGSWGAVTVSEPDGGIDSTKFGGGAPGLILMGYRYYSPDTGRFLTRDPIGYDGGMNVYAYTRNNPVMGADPMGLQDSMDFTEGNLPKNSLSWKPFRRFWRAIFGGAKAAKTVAKVAGEANPISMGIEIAIKQRATEVNQPISDGERLALSGMVAMPLLKLLPISIGE